MPDSCYLHAGRSSLLLGSDKPNSAMPEESVSEDMVVPRIPPTTTPTTEESQDGDTIFVKPLAIKDPERLRLLPDTTSALEPAQEICPEPTELSASTAPVRM